MRVKNISHITLSKAWATLHRIDFDYRFNNGQWKKLSRETYNRGDGVAIFLYNKKENTVILTRQFRMPIFENNREEAMSIEVCAGAIDNDHTPLTTVIREVEEEIGLRINDAEQVMSAYTSPGALTEMMYFFIADYSDAERINSGGGSELENEELEVLEIPFSKAIKMLNSGEIKDAKTIMLLQYAQMNNVMENYG